MNPLGLKTVPLPQCQAFGPLKVQLLLISFWECILFSTEDLVKASALWRPTGSKVQRSAAVRLVQKESRLYFQWTIDVLFLKVKSVWQPDISFPDVSSCKFPPASQPSHAFFRGGGDLRNGYFLTFSWFRLERKIRKTFHLISFYKDYGISIKPLDAEARWACARRILRKMHAAAVASRTADLP